MQVDPVHAWLVYAIILGGCLFVLADILRKPPGRP